MRKLRPSLSIVLGILVAVGIAEVGLREVEAHMPVLSEWPTIETEVKRRQFDELAAPPQLLVVGSSMTESAVDPAALIEMGATETAYNTAFPFYSPAAMDIWLHEFLEPWEELEVIVIGLTAWPPSTRPADDPLTRGLMALTDNPEDRNAIEDAALWRLRGLLGDLEEAARRERSIAAGLWTDLGHQTFYYGRAGGSLAGRFPPYGEPTLPAIHEAGLRRIVATAQAGGATPVLLLEPGRFPDPVDEAAVAAYVASLQALAAELGVELWDSFSMDWDSALYADEAHFNERGTEAFTAYLGSRLRELRGR